ncbi:hypothetical protein VB834_07785 [Limnoraphis robusta Tam1]|uniref:hypothetical protein n=1 Tax=Limnoraphis robusta TaxID=1118279 RepID=UPI002B1F2E38|nr:hypothetical protein [Limnoraphis robusta]MEA5538929.1 hypothetical protein [Limnoraphis robusta Tam1]
MLIFFIHGVAARTSQYANSLQSLLEKEFRQRQEKIPLFYSGFWGNVYRELEIIWNRIDNAQDPLKHQEFRKGYFSQFVGDAFTYLGSERGAKIRETLANQLIDFLQKNPLETELHIITHSLGTVILWDILFSDKFQANDPAFKIREILNQTSAPLTNRKINLKSITTMGSPISLFNIMLEVKPQQVNLLAQQYSSQKLNWLNLIHVSDIIAYPIHPVLDSQDLSSLFLTEEYLQENVNPLEATLEQLSELINRKSADRQDIKNILSYAQVAAGSLNAHTYYWKNDQVAYLIVNHILEQYNNQLLNQTPCIEQAIQRLKQVPGFTEDKLKLSETLSIDKNITTISFKDKSGSLVFTKNFLGIHNVYIFDHQDMACFAGYVGLIHVPGLKQEVEFLQTELGL